jgi:glucose-fructose oxidoreductase
MQAVLLPSWNWSFSEKDMALYGTKGSAITRDADQLGVRYAGEKQSATISATPLAVPNDDSLHYLVAVLRGDLMPNGDLTSLDTNMVVMQILDAARESARTGRTVKLAPLTR